MLSLIKPDKSYLDSYFEACQCTWGHTHNNYIISDPSKFDEWKDCLFDDYERAEHGIGLADGYLPNVTLWLVDTDRHIYIGTANIRLGLNDALRDYGGQIGYVVRNDMRGHGYGSLICKLAINEAHHRGFSPVLLTCIVDNVVSYRILQNLPFKWTEECMTVADGRYCKIARFLI